MLREDFQGAFARLSGVLQGDVGDQSLAVLYFSGQFFLRGAFMLCNIWDVLAPLQHCKFFWNRGGAYQHTQTQTVKHTQAEKILSNGRDQLASEKKQSCESLVAFQGHLSLSVGAVMIPPPASEGTEVGAEVAIQPVAWKPLFFSASRMEIAAIGQWRPQGENPLHPPPPSAYCL